MDNLSAHKVAGIAQAIAAAGASILYIPAYSPDLNPIEQLFAKLKALLRKAAARTRDELWDIIGFLLDAFTPAERRNFLENASYAFNSEGEVHDDRRACHVQVPDRVTALFE